MIAAYSSGHFDHDHERAQVQAIQERFRPQFESDSSNFCYFLINVPFFKPDGSPRGQYDLIICTAHSISIVELKAKSGTLSGELGRNYENEPLLLTYPNGKVEQIRTAQVEEQQKYLKELLITKVSRFIDRRDNHYRIDSYLVFDSPLDQSGLLVTNEQISKWFRVCTVDSFFETWEKQNHSQPFSLSEGDIYFLAERCLRLKEVRWTDFEVELGSPEATARVLSGFSQLPGYEHLNIKLIEREFRSRLTNEEYDLLLRSINRVVDLSDEERLEFRRIFDKASIPQFSFERMRHVFLSLLVSSIQQIAANTLASYQDVRKQTSANTSPSDVYSKALKANLRSARKENERIIGLIDELLWEYAEFSTSPGWKDLEKVAKRKDQTLKAAWLLAKYGKLEHSNI